MTFSQTQADFHVPLLLCLNLQLTEDRKEKMRTCTVNSLNPRMASGSRCQESSASFVSWDLGSKRPKDIHPGPLRCMRVKWRKNRAMISQVPLESSAPECSLFSSRRLHFGKQRLLSLTTSQGPLKTLEL